jgi:ribosomal protein S7
MKYTGKTKISNKNIKSKKSSSHASHSKFLLRQEIRPLAHYVPRLIPTSTLGHRKVQNLRINKRGSLLYKASLLITLQNKLMHDGRKGPAEKVFLATLKELNRYSKGGSATTLFYTALDRLKPALITVVRRVGRNYYNVPVPLEGPKQYKIAFQWLLEAGRKKSRSSLPRRIVGEVIATISSSHSEAFKKKEAMYRTVVTNRAYSHYRWI